MSEILRKTLKNGLLILAEKMPNIQGMTAIKVGVKIGSAHEDKSEQGILHLIEHLAFKSQGHRHIEQVNKGFEHNGIHFLAGTCRNVLLFEAETPCENLSLAMEELYLAFKNTKYDLKEVKREKESILGEILRNKDDPEEYSEDNFLSEVLRGTPFQKPILGSRKSLKQLSRRKLIQFKKTYFRPNNMVISICGKFDERELFKVLKQTFGRLKFREFPSIEIKEPVSKNRFKLSVIKKRKGISSVYLYIGYLAPGFNHFDAPKLHLLNSLLTEGNSSRLCTELVLKRGLGYDFEGCLENFGNFSIFYFYVQIADPRRFFEARELVFEEIKKIRTEQVEDLDGCKTWLISNLKRKLADINNRAEQILMGEVEFWAYDFRKLTELISKITPQEIQEAAQKYLDGNYTLFAIVPWGFRIRKYHLAKN